MLRTAMNVGCVLILIAWAFNLFRYTLIAVSYWFRRVEIWERAVNPNRRWGGDDMTRYDLLRLAFWASWLGIASACSTPMLSIGCVYCGWQWGGLPAAAGAALVSASPASPVCLALPFVYWRFTGTALNWWWLPLTLFAGQMIPLRMAAYLDTQAEDAAGIGRVPRR
jgi:hypothetical protein